MKNILHLFKRDVQNVSHSVIGMIVVMGLIIVPCLYAWFNIAGSWDPYGNTGNLKIAVVNTDEGYESDLIPVEVNVGENVTATLRGNENFDWVVLNDRDKAIEGVKSGAYYAAVVIPKTFSADMMTLFSTEVKHADIEFYENQKANAIAQIVTEKGSSAVQSQVNETFTKTITTIGLKTVSSLLDYMSTDQVSNFIANLSSTLGDSVEDLHDVQASATSLAGMLSSTSDSTTDILETYEASDVFDAVCATDVGTNLTKSHLLLQACEQTGVSVEESILVGDSTIEAKGAEEIGMDFLAVLYGWGFKTKEETEEYKCVGTVSSPAEISQKVMAL